MAAFDIHIEPVCHVDLKKKQDTSQQLISRLRGAVYALRLGKLKLCRECRLWGEQQSCPAACPNSRFLQIRDIQLAQSVRLSRLFRDVQPRLAQAVKDTHENRAIPEGGSQDTLCKIRREP